MDLERESASASEQASAPASKKQKPSKKDLRKLTEIPIYSTKQKAVFKTSLTYSEAQGAIFSHNEKDEIFREKVLSDGRVLGGLILGRIPNEKSDIFTNPPANLKLVVSAVEIAELSFPGIVTPGQWANKGVRHLIAPIKDFDCAIPDSLAILIVKEMHEAIQRGETVYVHCKAGKQRSASIVERIFVFYHEIYASRLDVAAGPEDEERFDVWGKFLQSKRVQVELNVRSRGKILQEKKYFDRYFQLGNVQHQDGIHSTKHIFDIAQLPAFKELGIYAFQQQNKLTDIVRGVFNSILSLAEDNPLVVWINNGPNPFQRFLDIKTNTADEGKRRDLVQQFKLQLTNLLQNFIKQDSYTPSHVVFAESPFTDFILGEFTAYGKQYLGKKPTTKKDNRPTSEGARRVEAYLHLTQPHSPELDVSADIHQCVQHLAFYAALTAAGGEDFKKGQQKQLFSHNSFKSILSCLFGRELSPEVAIKKLINHGFFKTCLAELDRIAVLIEKLAVSGLSLEIISNEVRFEAEILMQVIIRENKGFSQFLKQTYEMTLIKYIAEKVEKNQKNQVNSLEPVSSYELDKLQSDGQKINFVCGTLGVRRAKVHLFLMQRVNQEISVVDYNPKTDRASLEFMRAILCYAIIVKPYAQFFNEGDLRCKLGLALMRKINIPYLKNSNDFYAKAPNYKALKAWFYDKFFNSPYQEIIIKNPTLTHNEYRKGINVVVEKIEAFILKQNPNTTVDGLYEAIKFDIDTIFTTGKPAIPLDYKVEMYATDNAIKNK